MSYELKTLKDLPRSHVDDDVDFKVEGRDLREESIKWIKKMEETDYGYGHSIWLDGDNKTNDVKEIFMHFFNITEEDLK